MDGVKCPCCPWLIKGQPDITDDVRAACHEGQWFCCHMNGGTCEGAKLEHDKNKRKTSKEDESINNGK